MTRATRSLGWLDAYCLFNCCVVPNICKYFICSVKFIVFEILFNGLSWNFTFYREQGRKLFSIDYLVFVDRVVLTVQLPLKYQAIRDPEVGSFIWDIILYLRGKNFLKRWLQTSQVILQRKKNFRWPYLLKACGRNFLKIHYTSDLIK